jgi:hypothetical protein
MKVWNGFPVFGCCLPIRDGLLVFRRQLAVMMQKRVLYGPQTREGARDVEYGPSANQHLPLKILKTPLRCPQIASCLG